MYKVTLLSIALFALVGCSSKKSYLLDIGDGGNAHIEAGWMQNEIISGTTTGPVKYCSVPKDATMNPCQAVSPQQ